MLDHRSILGHLIVSLAFMVIGVCIPIKVVSNRSGWLARASAQDIPAEPAPTTSTLFFADLDGIVSEWYVCEFSTMYNASIIYINYPLYFTMTLWLE